MPELPARVSDVVDRADAALVAGWYHAVSIDPERFRAFLRFRRLPFIENQQMAHMPSLAEVDTTAEIVIERAGRVLGVVGGAAGLGGAATVPPEFVATVVAGLRLAQRLCVVYGFDPASDRGQMALCRALAAAYGVELPPTGPMRMRLRDLPGLLFPGGAPSRAGLGSKLARAVAKNSAWWVAGRLSRLVPLVSASSHAWDNQRKVDETGQKMMKVLRRLAELPPDGPVEDAQEL
jgi:hypothetical protein